MPEENSSAENIPLEPEPDSTGVGKRGYGHLDWSCRRVPRNGRGGSFLAGRRLREEASTLQKTRLSPHLIHVVTDRKQASGSPRAAALAALRGGVDAVQFREKGGPARSLYKDVLAVLPEARTLGARVLVNDRLDVALAASADGVHLPTKGLPPAVARELLPERMLLGASVHDLREAKEAVACGADYVTFGHVYPTGSKPGLPPKGVRLLAEIVESVSVPVLAIGGIDPSNVDEVLATGAVGIAVISSVIAAGDPQAAAKELRRAVDRSPYRPKHPFPQKEKRGAAHATDRQP